MGGAQSGRQVAVFLNDLAGPRAVAAATQNQHVNFVSSKQRIQQEDVRPAVRVSSLEIHVMRATVRVRSLELHVLRSTVRVGRWSYTSGDELCAFGRRSYASCDELCASTRWSYTSDDQLCTFNDKTCTLGR